MGSQVPALLLHTLIARQSLVSRYPGAPPGCQPPALTPGQYLFQKSPSPCQNYLSNFPRGPVFKIRLMQGVTGSIPGWGKMPHALEKLSLCTTTTEPGTATKSNSCSPQLKKAPARQWRPTAAKNKSKIKNYLKVLWISELLYRALLALPGSRGERTSGALEGMTNLPSSSYHVPYIYSRHSAVLLQP